MKIIGAILILAGLALGCLGFNKVAESSESVEIVGINIEASDKSGKQEGYIYLGVAVVLFAGGIYTLSKKSKSL
ncbi:MAG TPA: hypothetical protein VFQ50_11085 [Flavobacterium sp.]|jgi:hypothetical protein|nr:hypothetical protein [Flavobacterium sp.]